MRERRDLLPCERANQCSEVPNSSVPDRARPWGPHPALQLAGRVLHRGRHLRSVRRRGSRQGLQCTQGRQRRVDASRAPRPRRARRHAGLSERGARRRTFIDRRDGRSSDRKRCCLLCVAPRWRLAKSRRSRCTTFPGLPASHTWLSSRDLGPLAPGNMLALIADRACHAASRSHFRARSVRAERNRAEDSRERTIHRSSMR